MGEIKTISELAKEVFNARTLPGVLADLHIELATIYSNMNEDWVEIQLRKADFWQVKDWEVFDRTTRKREKSISDKQVEMLWIQTEEGKKELRLKYALKSLEKLMSAVKSSLVNATIESRNV